MRTEAKIRKRLESIEWFLRALPELMKERNRDVAMAIINTLKWVLEEV